MVTHLERGGMALIAAGQVVASAVLDPVCEKLIDTALEEYALVRGVKDEIERLRSTVRVIKAVLQDAEEKQVGSELVRTWLTSLRQILFDAEDVLDEVATDAALQKRDADGAPRSVRTTDMGAKVRNIICCFGTTDNFLADRGIAHRIKDIRQMLDGKSNEISGLGLQFLGGSSMSEVSRHRGQKTSSLLTDDIIGRDDEKKKIEELLLLGSAGGTEGTSSSNNVQVITVIGMGGVGKTTLVKLVYNSPRVKQHFQITMWVCVSNDFDLERIRGEILDAIPISADRMEESGKITSWDRTQIRLKENIEGKKFLLVLDDMWEEKDHDKWDSLCEPLKYGGRGSKIVVTTRNQKVCNNIVKGTPIFLKTMSSENLWAIFERFAFEGCDPNKRMQLAITGRQIAEKLKGLPLAAKIVGRLLNANLDAMYWRSIMRSEIWTQSRDANDILPILKLSYDHLPGHLKQCFAYCSLFPKDYGFAKDDELVQLWMAQVFIQVPRGFHLESVMSEHFDELLQTCFFEPSDKGFVMHDLIHDLAESVSKDDSFKVENDRSKEICKTVRHVSILADNFDPMRLEELCKHGNLRTLLFLRPCKFDLSPHLDDLFMKLKRLRVLRLSKCKIKKLPKSIGTLKHLRYVDLSTNLITMLPESICNLHNLQVLRLRRCRLLGALPRNLSGLVNLMHLLVDTEMVSSVQGFGKLTALQELIVAGSKVRELADIGMLKQLRILRLEEVASKEAAIRAKLEAKEHLDVLELKWSKSNKRCCQYSTSDEEVVDVLQPVNSIRQLFVKNYEGAKSPRWMEDPSWLSTSFLERLELKNCTKWEVLPPDLSQLPCLKFLRIEGMSRVRRIGPPFFSCGTEMDAGGGGVVKLSSRFPSLEVLEFQNMSEWEEWEAPPPPLEDHGRGGQQQPLLLPRLHRLRIVDCMKLRQLPPLPPTLADLMIHRVGLTHLPGWMRRPDYTDHAGGDLDVTPSSTSSSSPSLSSLFIVDCPNLTSLGNGLLQHPLPSLENLTIYRCKELASLPDRQFRHLTALERLSITDCPKLSWPPSATKEDALPSSLEDVEIQGCGDMIGELLLSSIQKLTSLSKLDMDVGSPDTMAAVVQLTSLTSLDIKGDSRVDNRALSTCLRGLTSLKYLSISNCSAITTLAPEEVLRGLTALEGLRISNCVELRSLGGSSPAALVSLMDMEIDNCPRLLHLVEDCTRRLWIKSSHPEQIATWLRQCLSLQALGIQNCPLLTCIEDDGEAHDITNGELEAALLNLAPSLRRLYFWDCENLQALPSKLRILSSLERLNIIMCPKIQCLPSAGLPTSLEDLTTGGCPELEERCRKEGCPDWPLMSHIPLVEIQDSRVKVVYHFVICSHDPTQNSIVRRVRREDTE